MNNKLLNVVYIGEPKFPLGGAMTKRWRYMVDYMNAHKIQSHILVCGHTINKNNPQYGLYGIADFYDISHFIVSKHPISYWAEGRRILKKWYNPNAKNILIFSTRLVPLQVPFFMCARKMGYITVFDQVETSILKSGKLGLKATINEWLSDKLSRYGVKKSHSFVISTALYKQNKERFPNSKLCLLPNSTPIFQNEKKQSLHKPLRVLYSGTFAPKDGVSYLIDGAKKAFAEGCNLELTLLGKGLPWDMKVLEKIEGCSWVKYLGYVDDDELKRQMLSADVLCMTRINSEFSNYGFPFKLSEYLATGNILLASKVGDVCNYVKDRVNAVLVEPENSDSIAVALLWIAEHEQESLQVAHNSINVVNKYFSIEVVGKIFSDFLKCL